MKTRFALMALALAAIFMLIFSASSIAQEVAPPTTTEVKAPKAAPENAADASVTGHGLPLATIMFERRAIPLRIHTIRVTGAIGCDVQQGVLDCQLNLPKPPPKE